jgi:hypothetical protein
MLPTEQRIAVVQRALTEWWGSDPDGPYADYDADCTQKIVEAIRLAEAPPPRREAPPSNWRLEFHSSTVDFEYPGLSWEQAWRLSQMFAKMSGEGTVTLHRRDGNDQLCAVCGSEASHINVGSDDFGKTISVCENHREIL